MCVGSAGALRSPLFPTTAGPLSLRCSAKSAFRNKTQRARMSADDGGSGVACSRCPGFLIFKPTSFGSTVANFSTDKEHKRRNNQTKTLFPSRGARRHQAMECSVICPVFPMLQNHRSSIQSHPSALRSLCFGVLASKTNDSKTSGLSIPRLPCRSSGSCPSDKSPHVPYEPKRCGVENIPNFPAGCSPPGRLAADTAAGGSSRQPPKAP